MLFISWDHFTNEKGPSHLVFSPVSNLIKLYCAFSLISYCCVFSRIMILLLASSSTLSAYFRAFCTWIVVGLEIPCLTSDKWDFFGLFIVLVLCQNGPLAKNKRISFWWKILYCHEKDTWLNVAFQFRNFNSIQKLHQKKYVLIA